jgi:hypothetical protein
MNASPIRRNSLAVERKGVKIVRLGARSTSLTTLGRTGSIQDSGGRKQALHIDAKMRRIGAVRDFQVAPEGRLRL